MGKSAENVSIVAPKKCGRAPYSFVNPSITKRRVEGVRRFRVAGMTGEEGWRIDCVILKHGSALDAGSGVVQSGGCISNVAFVNMQPGGCT